MRKTFLLFLFLFFSVTLCSNNVQANSKAKSKEKPKQIIMLGDSRTCGTEKMYNELNKNNSLKKRYSIKFIDKIGSGWNYWFNNSSNYKRITDVLSKANKNSKKKKPTKVIVWLGVNDCGYNNQHEKYASSINNLAKKYKNLDFYYFSPTPVNIYKYSGPATNAVIKKFNNNLRDSLKMKSRYNKNLKYYNVFSNNCKNISESKNTSDGLHYTPQMYNKLLKQMLRKI